MSADEGHQLVSDYLRRLADLLGDVPFRRARELLDQIEAHLADALPADPTADQVRGALDQLGPPEEIAAEALSEARPPVGLSGRGRAAARARPRARRAVLVGTSAAVIAGLAIGLTGWLSSGPGAKPGTTPTTVPVLLSSLPRLTPAVLLASGHAGREEWRFYVSMDTLGRPHLINVPGGSPALADGLTTIVQFFRTGRFVAGDGGPGGDPRHMPRFQWSGFGGSGINGDWIVGVTSLDVAGVRVEFDGSTPPVSAPALTTSALPGLRFFIVEVPNWSLRTVVGTDPGGNAVVTDKVPQPTEPSSV